MLVSIDEITQVGDGTVVSVGPKTLYKGPAYPTGDLKGEREYFGGPSAVRLTPDYDPAKATAEKEAQECEVSKDERRELQAQGIKVEVRPQSCIPRVYRVEADLDLVVDCGDKPSVVPAVSIQASHEGLDGYIEPKSGKRTSDYWVFQPESNARITSVRMLNQGETIEVTVTWESDLAWDLSADGSKMRVRLDVGGAMKATELVTNGAASGTASTLRFRYMVHSQDRDDDRVDITPARDGSVMILRGGATLKGATGCHALRGTPGCGSGRRRPGGRGHRGELAREL